MRTMLCTSSCFWLKTFRLRTVRETSGRFTVPRQSFWAVFLWWTVARSLQRGLGTLVQRVLGRVSRVRVVNFVQGLWLRVETPSGWTAAGQCDLCVPHGLLFQVWHSLMLLIGQLWEETGSEIRSGIPYYPRALRWRAVLSFKEIQLSLTSIIYVMLFLKRDTQQI